MAINNSFFYKRRSVTAKNMLATKVSEDDLKDILSAGIRVPDHGALNPWKIVVIKDDRLEKFDKDVILQEFLKENPNASEKEIEIESSRFQRGGVVLAVLSTPVQHPKIPKWEMHLSSAAVCMNLLSCAQSKGYAAQWITEWYAYNKTVIEKLGGDFNKDKISGFIYIGQQSEQPKERRRPNPEDIISYY